jgi:hypothetical protein
MVEYWIQASGLLSAAVVIVCVVIAVILLNMQTTGTSRVLGVVGVAMVFASTILEPLAASLGSAYGTNNDFYTGGSVLVAVLVAGGLVLLALGVVRARKAKSPGADH